MPAGSRSLERSQAVTITYSAELKAQLDACRPAGSSRCCPLDKGQKTALLAYWPIKNHDDVAHVLGLSRTTALKWYRILTGKDCAKEQDMGK